MQVPPIVEDLWPVLKARASTATMTTLLGGTGRLVMEGEYDGPPDVETKDWRRGVIVPVLPPQGITWEPGLPTLVRWLFRVDMNNIEFGGLKPAVWASRAGQLIQREAARQWESWDPGTVLISSQVMAASRTQDGRGLATAGAV
jgi:hypothetical protein